MVEVVRIGIPETDIGRYFGEGAVVQREEVIHVTVGGEGVVSIYPANKFLEFSGEFEDPMSHGPRLREFLDEFRRRGYKTNLK